MQHPRRHPRFPAFFAMALALTACAAQRAPVAENPLPAWNDGPARQAIVDFVTDVSTPGSENFVPPAQRIAVFDNDGTLWAEKPTCFQWLFIVDRVRALPPEHPEWAEQQPFKALLEGDMATVAAGGGIGFMRPWTEAVYGIPPDQVVGSSLELRYVENAGDVAIEPLPELHFIDDKAGKPVGIQRYIGRRPILAAGNSDGDYEMLCWTTAGEGRRRGLIVHHTDAEREWAYDRDSHEGRLDRALDEAGDRGWTVIDMKNDWNRVWPD